MKYVHRVILSVLVGIPVLGHFFYNYSLDNYFSISSENDSYYIVYLGISFFQMITLYTGLWSSVIFLSLIFLFWLYGLNYKKIYSRVFALSVVALISSYFFIPELVGKELYFLLTHYTPMKIIAYSLCSIATLFFIYKVKNSLLLIFKKINFSFFKPKLPKINFPKFKYPSFTKKLDFKKYALLLKEKLPLKKKKEVFNEVIEEKIDEERIIEDLPAVEEIVEEDEPKEEYEEPIFEEEYEEEVEEYEEIPYDPEEIYSEIKDQVYENPVLDDSYFQEIIEKLEEKFKEFNISGKIVNVMKGPVVDTFELELGPGVKVSKVVSITEDLSLALSGPPLRMVYPMKGKTTIGIEVPRNKREIIGLGEIIDSEAFKESRAYLPIALGKTAFGDILVSDLARMPHMLVAGATGAGKSVFINSILIGLLLKRSPEEMKLMLIDPKQLELSFYNELPHLLLPVMTDPKRASFALLWCCEEMEKRYSMLKTLSVRSIDAYNEKIQECSEEEYRDLMNLSCSGENVKGKMPYIVVIIDEFADLILGPVGKEIEKSICRLAAKARACGIHLIMATQRPSVDVITGLIKANFPSRVSFKVTSSIDSRTILNCLGAEKLLGKGDMLFKQGVDMTRVHSAYIDEKSIEAITSRPSLKGAYFSKSASEYVKDLDDSPSAKFTTEFRDDLYEDAKNVVIREQMASTSLLQRRLRIGHNRAANIIDSLEEEGIIGPHDGPRGRKVHLKDNDAML